MSNILQDCQDISIYLGNTCNFNCSYCDRDYIKDTIGGQLMEDTDSVISFLEDVLREENNVDMISFHGGEPFVYVNTMHKLMERICDIVDDNVKFFVQTNGSLIEKNEDFIRAWGDRLIISISYDFMFQGLNRTDFDIQKAISVLTRNNIHHVQFQYVMPINSPQVFSFQSMQNIVEVCRSTGVSNVNLIPLRHIRGKDKFKVIVDEIDLPEFFGAFITFVQMLYVQNIDVVIDGHGKEIDKDYFSNHKQMVLSPDGFIYPEYDFLEYKVTDTRLGSWRDQIEINRNTKQEDDLIPGKCVTCPSRPSCGLKFLYNLFGEEPGSACVDFYKMLDIIIKHNIKLKQNSSLFKTIGI